MVNEVLMAALQGHGCVNAWLAEKHQDRQLTILVIGYGKENR